MKLLLIDTSIKNKEVVIDSLQQDTDYILFSYYTDKYKDVVEKIKEKGNQYEQIALFQHSKLNESYKILYKEGTIANVTFKQFISQLKFICNLEIFDFLACSVYNKEVIDELENETNINFRASSNFTGNEGGADWILESDNVNIRDEYFTENILNFKENLLLLIDPTFSQNITHIRDICGNIKYLIRDICGNPLNPTYNLKKEAVQFPEGKLINIFDKSTTSDNVISVFKKPDNIIYLKNDGTTNTNATNIKAIIHDQLYLNNSNEYIGANGNILYKVEEGITILSPLLA
jgi:hypothetical protein